MSAEHNFTLVETADALQTVVAQTENAPHLFVDTEFLRERTYFPQLCLVQVCDGAQTWVVDPIKITGSDGEDASHQGLRDLLCRSGQVKVFHAAGQDLEVLHATIGAIPAPLYDTQTAATLLGWGDQIGYSTLVERATGISLPKAYSRLDWAKRPLPAEALAYAAADVIHLATSYDVVTEQLAAMHRERWLDDEFAALADATRFEHRAEGAWTRVKGLRKLRPAQRQAGARVAAWREDAAVARDLPRRWVLKDDPLLDIAKRRPDSLEALATIRGIDDKFVARDGDDVLEALRGDEEIAALAENPKAPLKPEQEASVDLLMAVLKAECFAADISPTAVASKQELVALVAGKRDLSVLAGWKRKVAGQTLLDIVEGRAAAGLDEGVLVIEE